MDICALRPEDAAAFQSLRLQGLRECPGAIASSHAEAVGTAVTTMAERLAMQDDRAVFAASGLGVRQVTLGVNERNTAAIALYRSLGFETFCVERGFLCIDGVLHDELHTVRIL